MSISEVSYAHRYKTITRKNYLGKTMIAQEENFIDGLQSKNVS